MSKSLGNSLRVEEILENRPAGRSPLLPGPGALPVRAGVLRGFPGRGGRRVQAHRGVRRAGHRSPGWRGGQPRGTAHGRLALVVHVGAQRRPRGPGSPRRRARGGPGRNGALQEGRMADVRESPTQVRAMLAVLGLDPLSQPWAASDTGGDGCATSSSRSCRWRWTSARPRGPGRTTRPPTRSGKAWRRPPSPSTTPARAPLGDTPVSGRGSGGGRPDKGNYAKSGKPRPGTGGYGRRRLEGKGPTPPARMRPGDPPQPKPAARGTARSRDRGTVTPTAEAARPAVPRPGVRPDHAAAGMRRRWWPDATRSWRHSCGGSRGRALRRASRPGR